MLSVFLNCVAAPVAALMVYLFFRVALGPIKPASLLTAVTVMAMLVAILAGLYHWNDVSNGTLTGVLLGATCSYFFPGRGEAGKK